MQKQGTVVRWNAERAFGFIRSPGTPADVFFHVRDFRGSTPPPVGLSVVYEEIHVGGKGPRAMAVQPASGAIGSTDAWPAPARRGRTESTPAPAAGRSAPPRGGRGHPTSGTDATRRTAPPAAHGERRRQRERQSSPASASLALALTVGWILLLGWGIHTRQLPLGATLAVAFGVNGITFWAYAADKAAAMQRRWRTQESHLHLLGLAGGWPAAWLAQQALRHKSSKQEFRTMYWLTVAVHCAALAAWVTRAGR